MSYTLVSLLFVVSFSLPSLGERINSSNIIQHNNCSHDSECPTWFTCNSSSMCQCGNKQDHAIACDDKLQSSAVLDCYCVTYDIESGSTYLGLCFYNCDNHKKTGSVYQPLPTSAEMLINGSVCTDFNRAGLLCGNCQDGYRPFVLSYNLSCVKCPNGNQNWWKFIFAGFGPLTFFYFFVVLFSINVTSSHLHGVVWFSQMLSIPTLARSIMLAGHRGNLNLLKIPRILGPFYSIWNLDFFRTVIPDICLNVTTLQALALDYLVALYPFLLILFSHMIIKLYDSHVHCMTVMWRPFRALLAMVRESMDIRTSIIDSFATFFLLSYIKVLSVTSDLLIPTRIYKLGSNISTLGVYYSPTVVYFGDEHLPYAVLPLLFRLMIFIIFTLTLSMMFYVYAVITLTVLLLVIVNVQPFKKSAVRYPSTDPIFLILLSLIFVTNIGRDVTSRENLSFYYSTTTMLGLSVVVSIAYITFLIILWLARRVKWIHELISR